MIKQNLIGFMFHIILLIGGYNMDLFKFTDDDKPNLINGFPILNYDSIMWIERYSSPGEFTLTAKLSSGLQNFLPLGSIISHSKTYEACIVENHEIQEDSNSDPVIKITGRSLDSYLENRIVGLNIAENSPTLPYTQYELQIDKLDNQIAIMINDHINLDPYVYASSENISTIEETRVIKRQTVAQAVLDLLGLDNLGIRVVRKNPYGAITSFSSVNTRLHIHKGVDHSNDVIFSWNLGELENASYLFSLKPLKNAALVQSTYLEVVAYEDNTIDPYDIRYMIVDASDIDSSYTELPDITTEVPLIINNMITRGFEALSTQKTIDISSVNISKTTSYKYRQDYDIGDIVSISGNYGITEKRRVVEFVEIEDENGEVGYPTLAKIEGD